MPIYEYKCAACGAHVEKLQKASDEPLQVCGECGGKLEKQWSLSGFQFKGEGWYVTDYAKKKGPASDETDAASSKSSEDGSTEVKDSASKKPSETKPASKKEKTPASD